MNHCTHGRTLAFRRDNPCPPGHESCSTRLGDTLSLLRHSQPEEAPMNHSQPTTAWNAYVTRARARHGDQLTLTSIPEKFLPYFNGRRIRVRTGDWERTGVVSASTGWAPTLMLMHRSNDFGSWDTLNDADEIVAVQYGRTYVPVANLYAHP